MERLINFFHSVDPLSAESKDLLRSHLIQSTLKKGTLFYDIGKVCNRIGYVLEGVLRVVQQNDDGSQINKYFITEGHFAVDLESYNNRTPCTEFQEALSDCDLVIMKRETMEMLHKEISNFTHIIRRITEKALLEKYKLKSEMLSDDALTRYAKLLQRNPSIVQRVPLGMIASYMGVTQFTLSRIRKQFLQTQTR